MNDLHQKNLIAGIDATNLRAGGGLTMLKALANHSNPSKFGFKKVYVWGSKKVLDIIPDNDWLIKINPSFLNKNFIFRVIWQIFFLSKSAKDHNCSILFIPGGNYFGSFKPIISMSTNILPFDYKEIKRFGFSLNALRMLLLRYTQSKTFKGSDGIIFLSKYAETKILNSVKRINCKTKIIPFGVNSLKPIPNLEQPRSDNETEIKLMYISFIGPYKHQISVVKAVNQLRKNNHNITIDLVGPVGTKKYANNLNKLVNNLDPDSEWVNLTGELPLYQLRELSSKTDIGVFASSCENLPNILLEKMTVGFPIACSNYGPMPEVLKDGGVFFDPECPDSIASAILFLINNPDKAAEFGKNNQRRSLDYRWDIFSDEIFKFLSETAKPR